MTPTTFSRSDITLRAMRPEDESFLCRLYATTRSDEMAVVDWSEKQKNDFLTQQFLAQHKFYQSEFPDCEFSIIELEGKPVGRLYLDRRKDELRLVDIALIPRFRGAGIGTCLMKEVLEEGRQSNLPVKIHVERFNPAMHLYERLGFKKIDDTGVYYLMEWSPQGATDS